MMKHHETKSYLPTREAISHQIKLMLASPDFHATPQQAAFLKYVVEQTVAGNAGEIKGYTVATRVFGRGPDFDQRSDSIVSIQAGRLRQALVQYYKTAGQHDPIKIDIPKGTYVPVFKERPQAQPSGIPGEGLDPDIRSRSFWPTVLIRPLRNLTDDPELDFWSVGLATELADELNRYPDIRVMASVASHPDLKADQNAARFIVDGNVRSDGTSIKIILNLTDTRTGHQVWSESNRSPIAAAGLIAFQEDLARPIAVKIAGERGLIMKALDKESKRHPPAHPTVYEATLRFLKFELTFDPEAFSQALAALEKAVAIDSEYGPAWSMLARLYAVIYALDIPGIKNGSLEKGLEYAHNGARLSPQDQRCRAILAYLHLLRDDLATALAEADRALQLGPETLVAQDEIGYLMTLLGDWERGPALIENVIQLNPFYDNYVHYALWINYLLQKDYINAHQETLKLNRPALFWDHLARATSLGLLGHLEKGRKSAARLLKLKPDFTERGRVLIRHYIKFDDIFERIIKGLDAVGVEVR